MACRECCIDISVAGALVGRASPLPMANRLHLSLRLTDPLCAFVVRVAKDVPEDGPPYRAGVEFGASAASAVADFVAQLPR